MRRKAGKERVASISNPQWRELVLAVSRGGPLTRVSKTRGVKRLTPGMGQLWDPGLGRLSLCALSSGRMDRRHVAHLCVVSNHEPRILFCVLGSVCFLMISLDTWGAIYRENTFYLQILHAPQKKIVAYFSQLLDDNLCSLLSEVGKGFLGRGGGRW